MEEMTWQEPPNPVRYKRNSIDWATISDNLKANPGEWAVVAHDVNPSVVTHIRKGRLKAFSPAGDFEASGQGRNDDGYTKDLYVRFVGEVQPEVEAEVEEDIVDTAEDAEMESTEMSTPSEYRVINVSEESEESSEEVTAGVSASASDPFDFFNDPEL